MRYRDPKKEGDWFGMLEHQQSLQKVVKGMNKLRSRTRMRRGLGGACNFPG
ncbi:MAG: hypothetical protein R6U56_07425 [Opitutales bacterium]